MIGELLATVIGQGLDSVRYWLETLNNSRGDEIGSLILPRKSGRGYAALRS